MTQLNQLNDKITIKIGVENFDIAYPNVGQKLEIEKYKMILSGGNYGLFSTSSHNTMNALLNLIDAYAYLMVLCPDLKLSVDSFQTLPENLQILYISAFTKQIHPWLKEIDNQMDEAMKELNKLMKENAGK